MARQHTVMAIFSYPDDMTRALKSLKQVKIPIDTVFSPIPQQELLDILGLQPSPVRYFTLFGALLGMVSGFALSIYAGLQWSFITSGKPVIAWIPFFVEGFELAILAGVLSTLLGMLINSRMPRVRLPAHYDPRFTEDKFGILVQCTAAEQTTVAALFKEAGAEEIHAAA